MYKIKLKSNELTFQQITYIPTNCQKFVWTYAGILNGSQDLKDEVPVEDCGIHPAADVV